MRVELTEVLWMDEHHEVSLTELAEVSGLSAAELHELVDCDVMTPVDPGATAWTFRAECIVAARTARRLRDDFELDAQGIVVALTLLGRIRDLEAQLRDLRARLPRRIR